MTPIAGSPNTRRPWYQSALLGLLVIIGGFSALGAFLDAINNAMAYVTPPVTYAGTAVLVLAGLISDLLLRRRPLDWVTQGRRNRLTRLSKPAWLYLFGMIILLWIPWLRAVWGGEEKGAGPMPTAAPTATLFLDEIKEVSRKSLWGMEFLEKDEIVIKASVRRTPDSSSTSSLVAFWQLADGFETNWHVGKRRDGGNWRLATLDVSTLSLDASDFLIGGIECEMDYGGDIAVILLEVPQEVIDKQGETWVKDENGWGFRSLPKESVIKTTRTRTFRTAPMRSKP